MASVKVKSGGSLKSRKGNRFEYDTAYSLKEAGYIVDRIDDNTKGTDLIVKGRVNGSPSERKYFVECKNRQELSWNKLWKIYTKTSEIAKLHDAIPIVVFKSNFQPTLVMARVAGYGFIITQFYDIFRTTWKKRPKGYKLWK